MLIMNHLFSNIDIILLNFSCSKPSELKLTYTHFNGFIASSACFHEIIEHADDVSQLRQFAGYVVIYLYLQIHRERQL